MANLNEYYAKQYNTRWPSLLEALCLPPERVLRLNMLSSTVIMARAAGRSLHWLPPEGHWTHSEEEVEGLPFCVQLTPKPGYDESAPLLPPLKDSQGLSMG
jgi:hypothetical protein